MREKREKVQSYKVIEKHGQLLLFAPYRFTTDANAKR